MDRKKIARQIIIFLSERFCIMDIRKAKNMQIAKRWWQTQKGLFSLSAGVTLVCLVLTLLLICWLSGRWWQENRFLKSMVDQQEPTLMVGEQETINENRYLTVDIGGAVKNPGIYQLAVGSYVADLVAIAGGFENGKIDRWWLQKYLNLAEALVEGKKYYIPYRDEIVEEGLAGIDGSKATGVTNGLISVNQATVKELMTLSGIGEARAETIVKNRPYTSLDELVTKGSLTEKIFESIKPSIGL